MFIAPKTYNAPALCAPLIFYYIKGRTNFITLSTIMIPCNGQKSAESSVSKPSTHTLQFMSWNFQNK